MRRSSREGSGSAGLGVGSDVGDAPYRYKKQVVGDFELFFGCADHGMQPLALRVVYRGGEVRCRDDQVSRLIEDVGDGEKRRGLTAFGGHSSAGGRNGGFRHGLLLLIPSGKHQEFSFSSIVSQEVFRYHLRFSEENGTESL
jgi:hypothetical protein